MHSICNGYVTVHGYCKGKSPSVSLFICLPNRLMAQGTKEFFSLFVRLFGRSSLSLNQLLWLLLTVCSGWLALSRMPRSLFRVLLSATVTRGSSCKQFIVIQE